MRTSTSQPQLTGSLSRPAFGSAFMAGQVVTVTAAHASDNGSLLTTDTVWPLHVSSRDHLSDLVEAGRRPDESRGVDG